MAKNKQPDLVLICDDSDDSTLHGIQFVVVRPKNMTVNRVMKIVSAAYDKAKKKHPNDWNWGDIREIVESKGFKIKTFEAGYYE